MRKVLGVLSVAGLLTLGACNSLPSEVSYTCPTSSSADSTFAIGDTINVDCTRTAP